MRTRIFCTILLVSSIVCKANLVVNPGFETMESIGNDLPDSYGDWSGNPGTIVIEENGIVPFEGEQMLRFDATSTVAGSSVGCNIYQIIDVSGYEDLISSGNAIAHTSAYFNRVLGDEQTDTQFGLQIFVFDGSPTTFPSRWSSGGYDSALAWVAIEGFYSDGDLSTWEYQEAYLHLPVETEFLVVRPNMYENIYNDYTYPEFDGHYIDSVSVEIVPEPGTLVLLGSGCLGVLFKRRKTI